MKKKEILKLMVNQRSEQSVINIRFKAQLLNQKAEELQELADRVDQGHVHHIVGMEESVAILENLMRNFDFSQMVSETREMANLYREYKDCKDE